MKFIKPLLAAGLLLSLIACENVGRKAPDSEMNAKDNFLKLTDTKSNNFQQPSDSMKEPAPDDNQQPEESNNKQPLNNASAVSSDWDKKIIRTANLSLEVKEYKEYTLALRNHVKQAGGYIGSEEQNQSDYKIENNLIIKVPVDKFDALLNVLSEKERIITKKITSEDVSAEVVDAKSRMEAKRLVRLRYLDLLKQARNMEEILQVQNEINEIQVDLESAAGRIKYLTMSSAYSTIHLNCYQVLNPSANIDQTPSYGFRIVDSFKNGLQWIGELLIALITLWPAWLIIGLIWMMIKKYKPFTVKKS